jgi:hypothetical protein
MFSPRCSNIEAGSQSVSQPFLFLPTHSRCRGCLGSIDHTQTHTTVGRTPLDEGSARRRDLYLTTQTLTREKNPCPGGIRTHDRSKRSAADLRLRSHGHWDRHLITHHSLCLYFCALRTACYVTPTRTNRTFTAILPEIYTSVFAGTGEVHAGTEVV